MKGKFIARTLCFVLALGICFGAAACDKTPSPSYAQLYETTGTKSKLLARQSDLKFEDYDSSSLNVSVTVDASDKRQAYRGDGATMTHSSAYLLMQADEATRTEILNDFFSKDGAYFTNIRVPIGSNDYIAEDEFFTCDDMPKGETDTELEHFTLEHDADILAVLKEVVKINPDIDIIAVPWSAPAWMKSTENLRGGSLKDEYIDVYAEYLVRFVQEYAKEGVDVTYISPINEPRVTFLAYPYMRMESDQMPKVVAALGKQLDAAGLGDVKIMAYEHNYNSESDVTAQQYVEALMAGESKNYVDAISFHTYAGEFDVTLQYAFEYLDSIGFEGEIYLTETTEYDGSIDFASNLSYALKNVVLTPTAYGSSMSLYWNYVLGSDGTPVKGNSSVCFGVMNLDYGELAGWVYSKNAAYYAMAHLSKFACPIDGEAPVVIGAESSNSSKIISTAFERADGKLVVVVHNTNDATYEDVDIVVGKKSVTYRILPQSVITLVI